MPPVTQALGGSGIEMSMSKSEAYEAALAMYAREHDRWYQWALFFFGAIGGIFYVAGSVNAPFFVAPTLSSVISLMWVGVASNIRATTDCWRDTLLELESESSSEAGAFLIFKRRLEAYGYAQDFLKTLQFWRRRTYTSVTRLLVLCGLLSSVAFITITVMTLKGVFLCAGRLP